MNGTDFNISNDTLTTLEESSERPYTVLEVVLIASISAVLSIATVVGNVLVVVSFKMDRRLQTVNNYFLLSLASADFMIGLFSMPLFTAYTVLQEWRLGPVVCDLWLALDYLCSNASVLNLLMISFDRYFSVTSPLRYRARRNSKTVATMIACAWIISFITWPPWILAWPYIEGKRSVPSNECYIQFLETNTYVTIGTALAAFYIPVTVMCVLYYKIWRETQNRNNYFADLLAETDKPTGQVPEQDPQAGSPPPPNSASSPPVSPNVSCAKRLKEFLIKLCNIDCEPDGEEESTSPGATTPCSTETPLQSSRATSVTLRPEQIAALQAFLEKESSAKPQPPPQPPSSNTNTNNDSIYTIMIRLPDSSAANDSEPQPSVTMISEDTGDTQQSIRPSRSTSALVVNSVTENNLQRYNSSDFLGVGRLNSDVKFVHSKHAVKPARNKKKNQKLRERKNDRKAARTLTAILMAFIITWTPYDVLVLVKSFGAGDAIPFVLWEFSYYLCYLNSMINPMCYALANANFRKTYKRILTCTWRKRSKLSIIIRGMRARPRPLNVKDESSTSITAVSALKPS